MILFGAGILLLGGFLLGYGIREVISLQRRAKARGMRNMAYPSVRW
jgi:hypothetical protein